MIPETPSKLLIAEDWKKIYQSFQNSDFKSYDFETLRRTMISYLKEKYPEDFNDYIESSEYIALIDLIAFLGQNLSFRVDLNARENFLETAERRDSILRLAQLINYNPVRNVPASGLLKLTALSTTDNVFDPNGSNLANTVVVWNDPSNLNWYQQFLTILNSAMPESIVFGKPADKKVISGVPTEQYILNSANTDVPIFSFNKSIGGIGMPFEIVSCEFSGKDILYESTPRPAGQFKFIFKNDSKGAASPNTGFFVHFKQGTLSLTGFNIDVPVPNEIVGINASDINDSDVWLWQLDQDGDFNTEWIKVDALAGNNIIYNSLDNSVRNIYAVSTRESDQVDLNFADGIFGNLPKGQFRLFYRQSNGLKYSIRPEQMNGIQIQIPYINKSGQQQNLTLTFSLQYTVTNSETAETNESIKLKAPQAYYSQNRMVTGEDYNIVPLTAGTDIVKVKSINRISSGVSRYYELSDVSGKYSSTNVFADDGILYKDETTFKFDFTFNNKNEIYAVFLNQLSPLIESSQVKHFYFDKWDRPALANPAPVWVQVTKSINQTTGYFKDAASSFPLQTGVFSSSNLAYLQTGALVKFQAPIKEINGVNVQFYFLSDGRLTTVQDFSTSLYKWVKVALVIGDGANSGLGALSDGTGPIILTQNIDSDAIAVEIIPMFETTLNYGIQTDMVNLCLSKRNFGLSFSRDTREWFIISDTDLNLVDPFNLVFQKDSSSTNKDSSWIFSFVWTGLGYEVTSRFTDYIFESEQETSFYFDGTSKKYDAIKNTAIKDQIKVLEINSKPNSANALGQSYIWQIEGSVIEPDGFVEPKKIKVSFFDEFDDNQIDDPDAFIELVNPIRTNTEGFRSNFVYFQWDSNFLTYKKVDANMFITAPSESFVTGTPEHGQLFYFYSSNIDVVKMYNAEENAFVLKPEYFAKSGRSNLKFQYRHNSSENKRIDPSKTNIIDVYILTRSYDLEFRQWLLNGSGAEPLPPTSSSLEENFSSKLESVKSISDQIIYQPVKYKVLFGNTAERNLQATFKAVRNNTRSATDNEIKTKILSAIDEFFRLENWSFGQSFYFSELSTYVMNKLTPDITNFIIVPKAEVPFGSLYEIYCENNQLFINGATIENIEIIDAITLSQTNTAGVN
jgi:hypothetical protein